MGRRYECLSQLTISLFRTRNFTQMDVVFRYFYEMEKIWEKILLKGLEQWFTLIG